MKKKRKFPKRIRFRTHNTKPENVRAAISLTASSGRIYLIEMCLHDLWLLNYAVKGVINQIEGAN